MMDLLRHLRSGGERVLELLLTKGLNAEGESLKLMMPATVQKLFMRFQCYV